MTEQLPTIKLKGRDYVQVKDRVLYFNDNYPNGSISTAIISSDNGMVTFKCTIWPDCSKPERYYTGHAFGTVDEVKAFEKLETVAVGRCLALMGIGIVDSVASADEMQRFEQKQAIKPQTKTITGDNCPVCNKTRITHFTKSGKQFVGCDNWSQCVKVNKNATYWINDKT